VSFSETRDWYLSGQITKPEYVARMHALHAPILEYPDFISGSDVASIAITPTGVVLETRESGIRLHVDSVDERLVPIEIMNFGSYETDETRMVLRLVEEASVVFDIGANIGWYSLNLAKRYGSAVSVHAFEPIPATYEELNQNIALNGAQAVVQPHNFGFSDVSGRVTFFYYPQGSGNASIADLSGRGEVQEIVCDVQTIDDYVREAGVVPDLVKCDVEGAEFLVFKGGSRMISEERPIVFAEMLRKWAARFEYSPNDIIEWFGALGYACFTIRGDHLVRFARMDDETAETNFFFLHEEKHARQVADLEVTA
jgi:FkbM family methyltransferase